MKIPFYESIGLILHKTFAADIKILSSAPKKNAPYEFLDIEYWPAEDKDQLNILRAPPVLFLQSTSCSLSPVNFESAAAP